MAKKAKTAKAKSKRPSATGAKNLAKTSEEPQPRQLKSPQYRSFRLQKPIRSSAPKLKGGFKLFKSALGVLTKNWKPFLIIVIVYLVLEVLLVQSFGNVNLQEAKASLEGALSGGWDHLIGAFSLFAFMVGAAGSAPTDAAGVYQFIIMLICSLAVIWALRELAVGRQIRARDSFYKGMYPLVPVLLVLLVVLLQLLPLLIGAYIFNIAGPPATQATGAEWMIWSMLLFLLSVLTLYMLCSSLFALYVACLPGMEPMRALRSARQLVKYRRWSVMLRLLFLPLGLFTIGALIMMPLILFLTPAAPWVFFGLGLLVLPIVHSYMYALYRELLHEA